MIRPLVPALLACAAAPVLAQDHSGHAMPANPRAAQEACEQEAARHRAMGHPVPEGACAPVAAPSIPQAPPPAAAGAGPPRAADAIWGAEAMRASRDQLRRDHGAMTYAWLQGDRLEYRARGGHDGFLWDAQGWVGGDIDKLWLKSEGEGAFGEGVESADIQALWSHAIGPWWDVQAGVRQDFAGAERTHAVIGVQGLAPYAIEIDAAAFLSTEGELTASVEGELDQRVTQRLILQPRAEITFAAQDVPAAGIGAGVDRIELGLRLRYEIAREFAPYIGVEQEWKLGGSADYARLAGEDPGVTSFVAGVRFWF